LAGNNRSVQFTGIVVTYNEARRLRECLYSLNFCDQLLVVDLGSTDNSVDIAKNCGAEIVYHRRVKVVEEIYEEATSWASHAWIIFLDPDEVLPQGIEKDLEAVIRNHSLLGIVMVPYQFYFKGKPLLTTIWGQEIKYKGVVVHSDRVLFSTKVHRGYTLHPGYESVALPRKSEDYCIRHYWVDSLWQMLAKHWRYIQMEGISRYQSGERFRWRTWAKESLQSLKRNLLDYGGLRGGGDGIFLSFFHAWYVSMSLLSLGWYQKKVE